MQPEPFRAPKSLAAELNRRGIRGPGGHPWTARACRPLAHAIRAAGLPVTRRVRVRVSDAVILIATGWKPFARPLPPAPAAGSGPDDPAA